MKNIATITFHASHNYGSVLQAWALSKHIESLGYNVKVLNFRTQRQKDCYKLIHHYKGVKGFIREHYEYLYLNKLKKRYNNFEYFINNVLPVTKEINTESELEEFSSSFDYYVCGSDQIWNPSCQDFSPAYYLNFVDNRKKRIAYAPSLGKGQFEQKDKNIISSLIKNIDYFSVRENAGKKLIEEFIDKKVQVVCDPVLLLNKKYWDEIAINPKIKKPYMVVYFLENNHGNRNYIDYISQKLNLKVVVLNEIYKDFGKGYIKKYNASPFEFVGLIKNASFVYTNSFHATAFSIIFNIPFFSMIAKTENVKNNNDSRKIDILSILGLENRLKKDINDNDFTTIDFNTVNKKLSIYKEQSNKFLKDAFDD